MKWPSKCPVCGGELREKRVHEVLEEEGNTVILEVGAAVCLKCGEHLYLPSTIQQFEEIRENLRRKKMEGFRPVGKSYAVSM